MSKMDVAVMWLLSAGIVLLVGYIMDGMTSSLNFIGGMVVMFLLQIFWDWWEHIIR